MTRLWRKYAFSASHRLSLPELSLEENLARFGKCANPYGHGHNYEVFLGVSGEVDERTGRLVNPDLLDRYVHEQIVEPFHNRDMNHDVPDFKNSVPTTENLAYAICKRLTRSWPFETIQLDAIRIQETKRNYFELRNR
jgi:6-pyruvoyltetrahydropterin/6-carboxytetrahydropterin synthase